MSRNKHGRQKQKRSFPWLLVALGGVLLLIAAFFLANQAGDGGGTASIAVDQQKIDFGKVKLDTPKTFAITVTNNGDGILRFKEDPYIEVVEGC